MTLLRQIVDPIAPVSARADGETVYRRFLSEPDTLALCVVDDHRRPLGLVERNSFLVAMAAQHGRALWANRPVTRIMRADPLVADAGLTVAEFCGRVLEERPSELLHGLVITEGGCYIGVGTMLSLLQVSASEAATASRNARQALETRARFFAVMSHEIRTPLNGVLAVAEIMRRRNQQPELEPLIETVIQSGGVLGRLLNDALDLSRAEETGLELDEAPLRCVDLCTNGSQLWKPHAEVKRLPFAAQYEGPPDLVLRGDRVRLEQVINNLVSNALKFTGPRGVTLSILAEPDREGCEADLCIAVADTGPGVPQDAREQIFAPFQQTTEGLRRGGAGLGLAVCRQIAERMSGSLHVEDNPAGGARFVFRARLAIAAPEVAEAPRVAADETAPAAHILVVDDNPTNILVATRFCEIFGCTSEAVSSGAEAVAEARSGRFDVILMDIQMPGMDGVAATQRIRALSGRPSRVPIIALTANANPGDAAFYLRSGLNGVVSKPIVPERLLEALNAVLAVPDAGAASEAAVT